MSKGLKKEAATIWDVARAAGVSPTTVSRVLNRSGRISAATRARVLDAATRLHYRPRTARKRPAEAGSVLVLCDETHLPSLLADPFYGPVMAALEREAQAQRLHVVVRTVQASGAAVLDRVAGETRPCGLLLVGADLSPALLRAARDQSGAVVMVDDFQPEWPIDAIVTDNAGGVKQAVQHLVQRGHRRIGFVGGPLRHSSLAERYEGYRAGLLAAGISPLPAWCATDEQICGPEEGERLARSLLQVSGPAARVSAIVAANDMIAIGVLKAARSLGVAVPAALAVVGFDDIEFAAHTEPPLTTVRVPREEMGRAAIERLIARVANPDRPAVRIILSTELVVRAST